MKTRPVALFHVRFFYTFVVALLTPATWCFAQGEMTKEELVVAYEKSLASLRTWDVTYATGPVSQWNGWKSLSDQQFRWRKSGDNERKDVTEHFVPQKNSGQSGEKDAMNEVVPPSAEYTDGSKLWRLYGDTRDIEGIDLIDQKGLHAEIRPVTRSNILLGFPYYSFTHSLLINKHAYSIPQILKEFPTEIIERKQNGGDLIITTRSYLQPTDEKSRCFVQISFDSSLSYNPKQIVFPLNTNTTQADRDSSSPFPYVVRNFVEYHSPGGETFFPTKITSSVTNDINKLDGLAVLGKVAVSSITTNQSVDVPIIEFPPGVVVVIEESGEHTSYIWGRGNKPSKKLTAADYEAVKKEYERRLGVLPKSNFSTGRIIMVLTGALLIVVALVLRTFGRTFGRQSVK